MGLKGCYAVLKYFVFLMNLVFWLCGLVIVVLSVWMLIDPTFYVSMAQNEPSYFSGVCILGIAGALLFIVGFLGCVGALRESQGMLVWYFCGLLLILVAQIAAGVWAINNRASLESLLRATVRDTVQFEYGKPDYQSRTDAFDAIQRGLECCGDDGPSDWSSSSWKGDLIKLTLSVKTPLKLYEIPKSCCKPERDEIECSEAVKVYPTAAINKTVVFSEGCSNKLLLKLEEYMQTVIICFIGIGMIEFIGLTISLILCCAIRAVTKYK